MTDVRPKRRFILVTTTMNPQTTPIDDDHVPCGGCGGVFTYSDLFGHDCPDEKVIREFSPTDPALCSVDRPANWTGGPKNSSPGSVELASAKQVSYIASLRSERGIATPENETITRRQASRLIDTLLATPKTSTTVESPVVAVNVRRNKFAGTCAACRGQVAEMAGILTSEGGRWVVRHEGTCPEVVAVAPAATRTPSSSSVDVPDGYYAIESSGQNDLAFYKVSHSDRYGISVSLVVGGHSDQFVRRNAVAGIVERIAADVDGAAHRYADELGNCYRCNRTLTDAESRRLGIGPTCRARA